MDRKDRKDCKKMYKDMRTSQKYVKIVSLQYLFFCFYLFINVTFFVLLCFQVEEKLCRAQEWLGRKFDLSSTFDDSSDDSPPSSLVIATLAK